MPNTQLPRYKQNIDRRRLSNRVPLSPFGHGTLKKDELTQSLFITYNFETSMSVNPILTGLYLEPPQLNPIPLVKVVAFPIM